MSDELQTEVIKLLDTSTDPNELLTCQKKIRSAIASTQDMIATAKARIESLTVFEDALGKRIEELENSK